MSYFVFIENGNKNRTMALSPNEAQEFWDYNPEFSSPDCGNISTGSSTTATLTPRPSPSPSSQSPFSSSGETTETETDFEVASILNDIDDAINLYQTPSSSSLRDSSSCPEGASSSLRDSSYSPRMSSPRMSSPSSILSGETTESETEFEPAPTPRALRINYYSNLLGDTEYEYQTPQQNISTIRQRNAPRRPLQTLHLEKNIKRSPLVEIYYSDRKTISRPSSWRVYRD